MEQSDSIKTLGIDHVGLTVSRLDETVEFFINILGWELIGELPAYPAKFISNGKAKLTLWAAENPSEAVEFDRRNNIGLHHLAIGVPSFNELERLHARLRNLSNIEIEFAPELSGKGPHKHMIIREPSGVRIEFVHRPN